jgi:hypothetical protein
MAARGGLPQTTRGKKEAAVEGGLFLSFENLLAFGT